MAQVTTGWETINLRMICAQLAQPLRGLAGQRMTLDLPEQLAFAKRPVDDDADAAVPRQRKDVIFDLSA
jgi:hypothetical protein